MPNDLSPLIGQWYVHLDKGQRFFVTAIDERAGSVEVQHFDGDLEEFDVEQWRQLDIELSAAPENWSGAIDVPELDDLGSSVTDTPESDWEQPLSELRPDDYSKGGTVSHATARTTARSAEVDSAALVRLPGGELRERLSDTWVSDYAEDRDTGLWTATVYKHDTVEWEAADYVSLEDAVRAVHAYYDQL